MALLQKLQVPWRRPGHVMCGADVNGWCFVTSIARGYGGYGISVVIWGCTYSYYTSCGI